MYLRTYMCAYAEWPDGYKSGNSIDSVGCICVHNSVDVALKCCTNYSFLHLYNCGILQEPKLLLTNYFNQLAKTIRLSCSSSDTGDAIPTHHSHPHAHPHPHPHSLVLVLQMQYLECVVPLRHAQASPQSTDLTTHTQHLIKWTMQDPVCPSIHIHPPYNTHIQIPILALIQSPMYALNCWWTVQVWASEDVSCTTYSS